MTPLPDQQPTRRRVALRPRVDRYTMPTFRAPMTPRLVEQPRETYDPDAEARPFDPSELWDARLLRDAVLGFGLGVGFVVAGLVWLS